MGGVLDEQCQCLRMLAKYKMGEVQKYGNVGEILHCGMSSTTEKVRQRVGSIIMNDEGGVISSSGDLENNEVVAGIFFQMIKGADKTLLSLSDKEEGFKKLSVNYDGYSYVVAISNKKIHVTKLALSDPPYS